MAAADGDVLTPAERVDSLRCTLTVVEALAEKVAEWGEVALDVAEIDRNLRAVLASLGARPKRRK